MRAIEQQTLAMAAAPCTWLITGVAGFIGSNLLEFLLMQGQRVVGLDNFATGHRANLEDVRSKVGSDAWHDFRFIEGDICVLEDCRNASEQVDYVLHQAALGSVPRSIEDPLTTNAANISGFLNMLCAARDAEVQSFVYAASSSTYGDHPDLPKQEDIIGNPLSPYAVTKYVNELYAQVFARNYGFKCIGLRYFNVFGPRQDPAGAYAAVIPRWVAAMIGRQQIYINGAGDTSRDFCYIDNAVEANILAATADSDAARDQVYNVALNAQTTLNELYSLLRSAISNRLPQLEIIAAEHRDYRIGDVRHSRADISKAENLLGYSPAIRIEEGIELAMDWYLDNLAIDIADSPAA